MTSKRLVIFLGLCLAAVFTGPTLAQTPKPYYTPIPFVQEPSLSPKQLLEQEVLSQINEARVQKGLRPLRQDPRLSQAASEHSQEMLDLNYFSHSSPTPGRRRVGDRVRRKGVRFRSVAENIFQAWGHNSRGLARQAVMNWMNSPGHQRNILSRASTHTGVGVAEKNGSITITQVFAGGVR